MDQVETYGAPTLTDVEFNSDGTLKQSGKQNVKFYNKKILAFKGRIKTNPDGTPIYDDKGKVIPIIDPKTGLPFKDAYEKVVEMIRVETRGDTTIFEDVANELHKRQFYRQYKFFREGKIPDGNPIEDFDFFQPSALMELHMLGVHTLQQVAVMSDLDCERLKDQSGYEVRDIARQWLKANSPDGLNLKMTAQDQEIARLKRQIEDLQRGQSRIVAAQEIQNVQPQIEEAPVETMQIPAKDLKDRPRRV